MNTKEVSLKISERIAAIKIFDEFKGNISTLSMILDDVKNFVVSPEEWEKSNLVKKPNADGSENWNWNDELEKTISLNKESLDYLVGKIKEKNDAGEFTIADKAIVSLNSKLQ